MSSISQSISSISCCFRASFSFSNNNSFFVNNWIMKLSISCSFQDSKICVVSWYQGSEIALSRSSNNSISMAEYLFIRFEGIDIFSDCHTCIFPSGSISINWFGFVSFLLVMVFGVETCSLRWLFSYFADILDISHL